MAKRLYTFRVVFFWLMGLLAVELLVRANGPRWRLYEADDYRERIHACRRQRPDLVVIGGSPVSEGIEAIRLAGLHWRGETLGKPFNLGLPGGTATEFRLAIKHGVLDTPKLLVYGCTASDLNDTRQEPNGPRCLVDRQDLWEWVREYPKSREWAVRRYALARLEQVSALYRHRYAIRLAAADVAEDYFPGSFEKTREEAARNKNHTLGMRSPGGYSPRPNFAGGNFAAWTPHERDQAPFNFFQRFAIGGQHMSELTKILDWAGKEKVDVVLFEIPVTQYLEDRHPGVYPKFRSALADYAKEHGVRVIPCSRSIAGLTDADFGDLTHLNAAGARKLSDWLRTELEALGDRP